MPTSRKYVVGAIVLAILILAALVVLFFLQGEESKSTLKDDEQLYTVVNRDISKKVSVSGNLDYSEKLTITSKTEGKIASTPIKFESPIRVSQGDILFSLDQISLSNLESELQKLLLELKQAEKDLTDLQTVNWHKKYSDALFAAESAAKTLRDEKRLRNEALDFETELLETELLVHSLKQDLVTANNILEDLNSSVPNKILALEKSEMNAFEVLKQKTIAFEDLDKPIDSDKLASLENQYNLASQAVDNLNAAISNHEKETHVKKYRSIYDSDVMVTLREYLTEHENQYLDSIYKWFGNKEELLKNKSPSEIYKIWDVDLDELFDRASRADDISAFTNKNRFGTFTSEERPFEKEGTPWSEEHVLYWLALYPGKIVGTCDLVVDPPQGIFCVDKELFDSWNSLKVTRQSFETISDSHTAAHNDLLYELTKLEYNRSVAEDNLDNFLNPKTEDLSDANLELTIAAAEVESAKVITRQAYENLILDVDQQNVVIKNLEQKLRKAEEDLQKYIDGPTPDDISIADSKYSAALAAYDKAADSLNNIAIFDELEVSKLQSEINKTNVAILETKEKIEMATFRSPVDGILLEFFPSNGAQVIHGQIIATIASQGRFEFKGRVSESDILKLETGLEAEMKIDSVPEHKFHGDLTYLGHTPLSKDGVVTYQSTISIHNDSNYGLRSGLSATADIYLNRLPEQLAIPMDSVKSKDGKNYVRIQNNGVIIERQVVLGDNDEFWVSIISGISEKESIIIKSSSTSTKEFEIDWED